MIGQITPATGPATATCAVPYDGGAGPPVTTPITPPIGTPSPGAPVPAPARHQPSASVALTSTGAAVVHATAKCKITVQASRGRRHAHVTHTVAAGRTLAIRLSSAELRHLGSGKAVFAVLVNGIPRTTRVVAIPRVIAIPG
jgi:hypothetical protein